MRFIKEENLLSDVSCKYYETDDNQFQIVMQLDNGVEVSNITFPTIERCEEFATTYKLLRG